MSSVGYATLDIIPSLKGLQGQLDKGTAGPLKNSGTKGGTLFGDAAGKSAGSRFGSVFSKAAKAGMVGLAAAGAGAIKLGVDSISAASDLEESTNKVAQVFGDAAGKVFKFTEGTADALGQTNQQAREAAATFGIFGSAAGLADKKNARFAKRMTTLASDLASFNNTDPSQAVEALGAALRGESEPIRAYGVMLDEATLKAEALRLGILKPVKDQSKIFAYQTRITDLQSKYNDAVKENGKDSLEALKAEASLGTARTALQKATEGTLPPLTQQQKLLAAQSQIFKQTEVAQGDFARTSDGLANQQRRLAARFEDAKARLGKGLLPIMTEAADFLLDKGIPAFEDFADWFNKKGIPALQDFGGFVEDASGKVGDLIGFVKDLPKPAQFASLTALLGSGIVIKHKLSGIFDRGGPANPMFVVVTNPSGPPVAPTGGPGGFFAAAGKWLTRFGRAGGAGAAIAGGGFYMDRGIIDEKGNPAKIADEKRTAAFLDSLAPKLQLNADMAEKMRANAAGFRAEFDLIGSSKVRPEIKSDSIDAARDALAKFIGYQIDAGRPVTPYINTTSIERAIALARTLDAELQPHAVLNAGVDNGATYQHGSAAAGGNGRVNANIYIGSQTVVAHDYGDFKQQSQRDHQRSGLGGY